MLNIRPMDLQVLIPRTIDVAKMASVNEQQSATQQHHLSVRLKQTANEQQHQVQTTLSPHHEGKVTTEDLDHEKRKDHQRQEEREETEKNLSGTDSATTFNNARPQPSDPVRGHTIDIKT